MTELLIHPGFHKTGTTFLQQCVFSDPRFFRPLVTHDEAHELFVEPHESHFDPVEAQSYLRDRLADETSSCVKVVSSEILSGNILLGSRDSFLIARRLIQTFPHARVLFTVRKQQSFVLSAYLQYVKRGGRRNLREFLTFQPEPGYHWFDLKSLRFDRLVSLYAKHYGDKNVLVLPQELLRKDRTEFLKVLFDFSGAREPYGEGNLKFPKSVGKSPPVSGVPILRLANLFRPSALNPEGPRFSSFLARALISLGYRYKFRENEIKYCLERQVEDRCGNMYQSSNLSLQKFCPVSLSDLGYDFP